MPPLQNLAASIDGIATHMLQALCNVLDMPSEYVLAIYFIVYSMHKLLGPQVEVVASAAFQQQCLNALSTYTIIVVAVDALFSLLDLPFLAFFHYYQTTGLGQGYSTFKPRAPSSPRMVPTIKVVNVTINFRVYISPSADAVSPPVTATGPANEYLNCRIRFIDSALHYPRSIQIYQSAPYSHVPPSAPQQMMRRQPTTLWGYLIEQISKLLSWISPPRQFFARLRLTHNNASNSPQELDATAVHQRELQLNDHNTNHNPTTVEGQQPILNPSQIIENTPQPTHTDLDSSTDTNALALIPRPEPTTPSQQTDPKPSNPSSGNAAAMTLHRRMDQRGQDTSLQTTPPPPLPRAPMTYQAAQQDLGRVIATRSFAVVNAGPQPLVGRLRAEARALARFAWELL